MKYLESIDAYDAFNVDGIKRVWEARYNRQIRREIVTSMRSKNYTPCAIKDGEIKVFTEDATIDLEKWRTVYFLSKEEFEKVNKVSDNIKDQKKHHMEVIKLLDQYVGSFIHSYIFKKDKE